MTIGKKNKKTMKKHVNKKYDYKQIINVVP